MILWHGLPGIRVRRDEAKPHMNTRHLRKGSGAMSIRPQQVRIIHECRREAFETEARRGFSQARPTEAYMQSVEEAEREKPRRTRGSDDVAGIHE
jgi:hypothetical protein